MAKKETSKVIKKSSGQVKESLSKQSNIGTFKKSDISKSVGSGTGPKKKE